MGQGLKKYLGLIDQIVVSINLKTITRVVFVSLKDTPNHFVYNLGT
jgi:hypothetical protein